ncbi:hypothetical protein [Sphingobacterium paludis]|nr:hypothetical protein [Sphingobacterium paludis]
MMRTILYCFFIVLFFAACTKTAVPPTVEPEEEKEEEQKPVIPEPPQEYYVKKTASFEKSAYYFDSQSSVDLYLGTIIHMKDTSDNIYVENLNFAYAPFPIWYLSYSSAPLENKIPSFEAMKDYAKRNAKNTTSGFNSSSITFSDYAEIQRWLPNNVDTKTFLKLATYQDSTVARKPFTSVLQSESIQFDFFTDLTDFQSYFTNPYVNDVIALGRSPYFVHLVSYGKHYIIMAESDSTRVNLNRTLEKLIEENPITMQEENVLASSKVLIYLRTGKKESFIEKGEGAQEIKNMVSRFITEWKDETHQYDYPLHCILSSLKDYSTLRYKQSFDFLVKEKRNPEP